MKNRIDKSVLIVSACIFVAAMVFMIIAISNYHLTLVPDDIKLSYARRIYPGTSTGYLPAFDGMNREFALEALLASLGLIGIGIGVLRLNYAVLVCVLSAYCVIIGLLHLRRFFLPFVIVLVLIIFIKYKIKATPA